jgi:multicomponent Na+:H+ antiporter subunit G
MVLAEIGMGLMVAGGALSVTGAIGLLRFPDVYTRSHAQTVVNVGGTCLVLLGVALYGLWSGYAVKSLFLVFFIFMTSPVGTHAITRTAYRTGVRPRRLVEDELRFRFDAPEGRKGGG